MRCSTGNLSQTIGTIHRLNHCSCQEVLAEMVHTKDGSRVVREFLAQGTAKVGCIV